jgi:hypothetical protein
MGLISNYCRFPFTYCVINKVYKVKYSMQFNTYGIRMIRINDEKDFRC